MNFRRALTFTLLSSSALLFSASCSEQIGSSELVPIPTVTFICNTPNCANGSTGGTNEFRVTYSTFDCSSLDDGGFHTQALSVGTVTCTGASCTGTASSWIDKNRLSITQIPSSTYTVCVAVYRQGSLVSGSTANDAWAELRNVSVTSNSGPVSVSSGFKSERAP